MANYVENHLIITGLREDLIAFRDSAVGIGEYGETDKPSPLCFERLVPIAQKIKNSSDGDETDRWLKKNWGSYSDAIDVGFALFSNPEGGGQLAYEFLTKYSLPDRLIETASASHPNLTFLLIGFEAGAQYAVLYIARRGKIFGDATGRYNPGLMAEVFEGTFTAWRFLPQQKASTQQTTDRCLLHSSPKDRILKGESHER